jgi:carboxyl-terminal processing protease
MMRKTSLILLGAAAGVVATLITTQPRLLLEGARAQAAAADTYRQLSLFGDVFERVRADYVEKPDDGKLIESAINGMLAGLDPHSSYMDSKSFRDMQVQTRGEFGGLGIEVTMEEGLIKVVAPIDETPAAKAGIMANDIITHLDDEPVQGLTLNQAVEKMRGPVNTKIKLKIMRKGQDKPVEVSITRDIIRVRSVRSRLEGDDVGFIRVTQFNEQTTDGLKKAITDLTTQSGDKLKGFVIDLRNNPGGLLDQAISVSDAFLEKGEIVSTRGRNAEETQRFNARAGPHQDEASYCSDQRRLGFGLRDRCRRSAGSPPRHGHRHALVRQGIGANHHPAWFRQWSFAADHRALLHPVRPVDPSQRHLARS